MVETNQMVDIAQELKESGVRAVAHVDGPRASVEIKDFNAVVPHQVVEVAADEPKVSTVVTYDDRLVLR